MSQIDVPNVIQRRRIMKNDELLILVERLLSAAVEWNNLDHRYRGTWHELSWLKLLVEAPTRELPGDAVAQLRALVRTPAETAVLNAAALCKSAFDADMLEFAGVTVTKEVKQLSLAVEELLRGEP